MKSKVLSCKKPWAFNVINTTGRTLFCPLVWWQFHPVVILVPSRGLLGGSLCGVSGWQWQWNSFLDKNLNLNHEFESFHTISYTLVFVFLVCLCIFVFTFLRWAISSVQVCSLRESIHQRHENMQHNASYSKVVIIYSKPQLSKANK